jgi:hypothetical protein
VVVVDSSMGLWAGWISLHEAVGTGIVEDVLLRVVWVVDER